MVAVGLLAGCAAAGQEPPGLTASPSVTAESPTPSPTVEGPIDRSDPDLGIVFTDLPDVSGDARSALDMLTLFEVEFWRALSTGAFDPSIGLIASPDVAAIVKAQVDGNVERGWTIDGVFHVTADIIEADAATARATMCEDFTDGIFTNDGVTYSADEIDLAEASLIEVTLSRSEGADGPWTVTSYAHTDQC